MKWLWLSALAIVLDQITKKVAEAQLLLHQPLAIMPGFNLTLFYNKGAAFSFLNDAGGWQRWFFIVLSTLISIGLFIWLKKISANPGTDPDNPQKHNTLLQAAISLILGGAIGNLIDRVLYGQVTDFIQVYYSNHYFPAFNIADSAITLGAGLLILDTLLESKRDKNNHQA